MMVIRKYLTAWRLLFTMTLVTRQIKHATLALSGVPSSISNYAAANATLDNEEVHYQSYKEQRARSCIHSVSMINLAMENDDTRIETEWRRYLRRTVRMNIFT